MTFFRLLIIIFMSTQGAMAFDWSTGFHHVAPLMSELLPMSSVDDGLSCEEKAKSSLLTYISERPRNEKWRSYYKVPQLLDENLYQVKDVCEEAKKKNKNEGSEKKYALIAHKTHLCDTNHMACLSTFKSIADPCNYFIHDNFQVFHTRTIIGSHKPKSSKLIMDEYGDMGPSILVIDLSTCSLMPTVNAQKAIAGGMNPQKAVSESYYYTPPSLDNSKDQLGVQKFKSSDERLRFEAMKESLTKNIPALKENIKPRMDCFENGVRTLPGISDTDIVEYGEMEIKGDIAMRKLLDEQYIDQTGINPYSKP